MELRFKACLNLYIRSYAAEKYTKMKSSRAKRATETTVFIVRWTLSYKVPLPVWITSLALV